MARLIRSTVGDERGMALPTAMFVLVVLMALTFAFTSLGTSEPVIARNHTMAAQARAYAESGVERALWAMTNATPAFTSGVAAAPYDGSQIQTVSTRGGFTVRIIDGASANEKLAEAVGWAPDSTGQLRAARKVQIRMLTVKFSTMTPPCALCVMGTLEVGGNSTIDARANHCAEASPQGGTATTGLTTVVGSAAVYGPGNDTANESPLLASGPDLPYSVASSTFDSSKLTSDELALLKAQAQAAGTYFQGAQTFNAANPMPNGIVFVDTTTGSGFTVDTPDAEAGRVTINGNITWSGWLIVNGSIDISGTVDLRGMLYALNDFSFTGNGDIHGAVITENKKDVVSTIVDSSLTGSSSITYDCNAVRTGNGLITPKWAQAPGSYREVEGK